MARAHPGPLTGAAIASFPPASSSGRGARTGCTTGCSIAGARATAQARGRLSALLPEPILSFLRKHGLAADDENPPAVALSGGVSSDIWRVELGRGPAARSIVVKAG